MPNKRITVADIWKARNDFIHTHDKDEYLHALDRFMQIQKDASPEVLEQYMIEFDEFCAESEYNEYGEDDE